MGQKFNLNNKRNELYDVFKCEEYKAVVCDVLNKVKRQDKEFIKKLKIDLKKYLNYDTGTNDVDYIIDKLTGEDLS